MKLFTQAQLAKLRSNGIKKTNAGGKDVDPSLIVKLSAPDGPSINERPQKLAARAI